MWRRFVALMLGLALVLSACGGGEDAGDDTTTTTVAADAAPADTTADTAPEATVAEDDEGDDTGDMPNTREAYCQRAEEDNALEPLNIFGGDLEAQLAEYIAALDEMVANAPAEIADDVAVLADAGRAIAELLAEYEYDILAIPPEELTALEALDEDALATATQNIADFCGIDLEDSGTDFGTVGGDDLPDDFPEAMVPPAVRDGMENMGAAGFQFISDASFDEVVEYYTDLLGSDGLEAPDSRIIDGEYEGVQYVVTIVLDGELLLVGVLPLNF